MISRRNLIARLEQLQNEEAIGFEQRRRAKLNEQITQARQEIRSRRITIPQIPSVRFAWEVLPEKIRLLPGELKIEFSSPIELLECLLLLAQTVSEDWQGFEKLATDWPSREIGHNPMDD